MRGGGSGGGDENPGFLKAYTCQQGGKKGGKFKKMEREVQGSNPRNWSQKSALGLVRRKWWVTRERETQRERERENQYMHQNKLQFCMQKDEIVLNTYQPAI